jgi:hypothetical protein
MTRILEMLSKKIVAIVKDETAAVEFLEKQPELILTCGIFPEVEEGGVSC